MQIALDLDNNKVFVGKNGTWTQSSNPANNTGQSDQLVPPSIGNEFREYTFNSREIPAFSKFQIKVVMVGNNQAKPPKIKELRGIAFA